MPGPNTTGLPNIEDISLGRGIIMAALLPASGIPVAWRDLGNAPDISIGTSIETKDHYSSRTGLKKLDLQVVLSDARSVKFSLEEFNHENLAWFFSGAKAAVTNAAVAGFTVYVMVADGDLELGMWYDIKNSSGGRAYDITSADLTVTTNQGTPVAMVLGTDYEVNEEFGRIFIKSTSTVAATAIGLGKGLRVALAAKAGAATVSEVRALTQTSITVALRFTAENAANGNKYEITFWKVKLKASGDLNLISDEWMAMPFEAAAEENTAASPTSPTLTIRQVA